VANPCKTLKSALHSSDPLVQQFVAALEAENVRLTREIAKLEAKSVTHINQIALYKNDLDKYLQKESHELNLLVLNAEKEAAQMLARVRTEDAKRGKK
jgi:hypothetical protein